MGSEAVPDRPALTRERLARAAARLGWPGAVVVAVLLGNLLPLLGIVDVDPMASFSALGVVHQAGFLPGNWTVDLNTGATSQALGHLAAVTWLHGHVPWWNPYEGVGTPLAAGMQSAVFFPPTLLLAFEGGQLVFRILLEVIAGLSTYALVRTLGPRTWVAGVSGILYALNGTFSWYSHAEINPVCFLPLGLLGIELARRAPLASWRSLVLPLALALSIVAGFPEVAYIDALFIALWAVIRIIQAGRGRRLALTVRIAVPGALGVAVTAPLLVAFLGYLRNGTVGGHTSFATVHLPTGSLTTLGMPYLYGPLSGLSGSLPRSVTSTFALNAGGYLTVGTLAVGVAGLLFSRRELALRVLVAVWALVGLGRTYGVVPLERLVAAVPELGHAAFFRDIEPSIELGMVVLCAFGLEVCADRQRFRWWTLPAAAAVASGVLAAFVLGPGWTYLSTLVAQVPRVRAYVGADAGWTFGVLLLVAVGGALGRRRVGPVLVAAALVLDALVMFSVPELSAPRSVTVDTAPVSYLQSHIGDARFFSTAPDGPSLVAGPISPNYGSYFGIASVEYLDIPVPTSYQNFVRTELDPGANPLFFVGTSFGRVGPSAAASPVGELLTHLAAFEAIGVRYVVAGANQGLGKLLKGSTTVFDDGFVAIYQLPSAAPIFSVEGGPCRLQVQSETAVTADCSAAATLVRRELDYPGWTATIDGGRASIRPVGPIFMGVSLPAGRSTVRFSYLPSDEDLAIPLSLASLLALIGLGIVPLARRRRRRGRRADREPARPAAASSGSTPSTAQLR